MKSYTGFVFMSLLTLILSSGCATMLRGDKDKVSVNSLDSQAEITIDGVRMGQGSVSVDLQRGKPHGIKVGKNGCFAVVTKSSETFDPITLLGIFFDFGILTIPIDLASGTAWQIDTKTYNLTPFCPATDSYENFLEIASKQAYVNNHDVEWLIEGEPHSRVTVSTPLKITPASVAKNVVDAKNVSDCRVVKVKHESADGKTPSSTDSIYLLCRNANGQVLLVDKGLPEKEYLKARMTNGHSP